MKILNIALRNLNSLAGKWSIDLTHSAYDDGLFVITGPTGAGKTTILDAICLALYGQTPRVAITHDRNEVMSRGEDECWAEVVFETGKGIFRSEFKHKRKPRKKDAFDKYRVGVFRQDGSAADESIEDLTGLQFKQFRRAVMLPQGEFTAFLNARDDDRAQILEKITSTEIYAKISSKIFAMHKEAEAGKKALADEISGAGLLKAEDEAALKAEQQDIGVKQVELKKAVEAADKTINWHINLNGLLARLAAATREAENLAREDAEFEPARERLRRAGAADALLPLHEKLRKSQADCQRDENAIKQVAAGRDILSGQKDREAEEGIKATAALEAARLELAEKKPYFEQIREMDRHIQQANNEYDERLRDYGGKKRQAEAKAAEVARKAREKEKCQKDLEEASAWLEANKRDGEIALELGAMRAGLGEIARKKEALQKLNNNLAEVSRKLQDAREKLSLCQIILGDKKKLWETARDNLAEREAELQNLQAAKSRDELLKEKDSLIEKKYKIENVANLEGERAKLVEGEPCPLCGAIHHPYAEGNIPQAGPVEEKIREIEDRIAAIGKCELLIKKLQAECGKYQKEYNDKEKEELVYKNSAQTGEAEVGGAAASVKDAEAEIASREKELRAAMAPFGNTFPDRLADAIILLEARADAWNKKNEALEELNRRLEEMESAEKALRAVAESMVGEAARLESRAGESRERLEALKGVREEKYGGLNPDIAEKSLSKDIEEAAKKETGAKNALAETDKKLAQANGQLEELKTRLAQNRNELAELDAGFEAALTESIFASSVEFMDALMDSATKEKLENLAKNLASRKDLNAGALDSLRRQIRDEKQKNLDERPLEDLQSEKNEAQAIMDQLGQRLGAITKTLADNAEKRRQVGEKEAELARLEVEARRLAKLKAFIGSENGLAFSRKAQNITFGVIVHYANEHLSRLSDRYQLAQHPSKPFALEVVDADQFGEKRSIATLSGGETFLVSLALALGLSRMASNNAPIDCLFLDEGFGTLDKDSLDTAIAALRSLRSEGKLIGIITHVEELKSLPARIEIVKKGGGKSVVTGPGCARI